MAIHSSRCSILTRMLLELTSATTPPLLCLGFTLAPGPWTFIVPPPSGLGENASFLHLTTEPLEGPLK